MDFGHASHNKVAAARDLSEDLMIVAAKAIHDPSDLTGGGMSNNFPLFEAGEEHLAEAALEDAFQECARNTPAVLPVKPTNEMGKHLDCTAFALNPGQCYVIYSPKDFSAAARLVIPKFVRALCGLVKCRPSRLLVIPISEAALVIGTQTSKDTVASMTDPAKLAHLPICQTAYPLSIQPIKISKPDLPSGNRVHWVEWKRFDRHSSIPIPIATDGRLRSPKACFYCGQTRHEAQLGRCARCAVARYCSVECQRSAWQQHRSQCKEWAASRVAQPP
ncbi:hypothetical protein WJX72_011130 [[Myrmecia] bisecta]|uniref:MYND-type domain-containing protein n=1 Tax=[Myrmecia] bisecta TaxID=41462 RepID=A0AAW1PQC5_9CHLO